MGSLQAAHLWYQSVQFPAVSNNFMKIISAAAVVLSYLIVFIFLLACVQYG